MAPEPQDVYQPADAIVSSNFSPYSPSVSRVRQSLEPGPSTLQSGKKRATNSNMGTDVYDEHAPLLGAPVKKVKKPFLRPRPMWLVPFAVVASLVRGMTLAPRVQVYTQLSCNAIYGHDVYDHTNTTDGQIQLLSHVPLYSSLDPTGPHIDPQLLHSLDSNSPPFLSFSNRSISDNDDDEPDPRAVPSRRCLTDPAVQAGAARIQTIMTTTMGVLSALSTGWWGHFSERHGRLKVLAASTFGLFLTDLVFILVSTPHSIFAAHGHKLLIVTPIIEGLLGGWSTLQGATSAYVSDCTSDGSRAHVFSRFTGVFYLGFSLGPTLGAFLIRHPIFPVSGSHIHNGAPTVTSVFYIAAMCSFLNFLLAIFVFPESLDKKKAQHLSSQLPTIPDDESEDESTKHGFLSRVFSPLTLFMPKKIQTPEGNTKYDWSLTLMALALFAYLLSTGIFQIKYLYASHVYGWGAEQLGYYISLMGGARALHTLLIMPWVIFTFKPKPKPKAKFPSSATPANSVVARSAPLAVASPTSPVAPVTPGKKPKPTISQLAKEMSFDLSLIRISLLIDFCSQALVSIAPDGVSAPAFVGFTTLSSFGAGLTPAANSFALCVMQMQSAATSSTDGSTIPPVDGGAGRLFGALAIVQAIGQMILGPMLFGLIYGTTVAKYPKTIFIVASGILLFAIMITTLIRPGSTYKPKQQQKRPARSRDVEIERGRSRISKDLSTSPIVRRGYEPGPSSSGSSSGLSGYSPRV